MRIKSSRRLDATPVEFGLWPKWFPIGFIKSKFGPSNALGGISGLIAFYALKFPPARLGSPLRYCYRVGWVQLSAWGAFAHWILLQFFGACGQFSGFSNISALARLGGAAIGVGWWWKWRKIELQPARVRL